MWVKTPKVAHGHKKPSQCAFLRPGTMQVLPGDYPFSHMGRDCHGTLQESPSLQMTIPKPKSPSLDGRLKNPRNSSLGSTCGELTAMKKVRPAHREPKAFPAVHPSTGKRKVWCNPLSNGFECVCVCVCGFVCVFLGGTFVGDTKIKPNATPVR